MRFLILVVRLFQLLHFLAQLLDHFLEGFEIAWAYLRRRVRRRGDAHGTGNNSHSNYQRG
ncbi:hypothetical protein SBV1_160014 [Verrucomicrobia bacterium]|nr:hypothetical protein SBV1_160014 [Verrucomicrobiota bacterium]